MSDDNVTYTFTADITDTIVVQRSNITIDGNGRTLQGPGGEGFYLAAMNNVTIRNTNIKGFGVGIQIILGSHHNTICGNNITNNGIHGIQLGLWDVDDSSNNNIISGNNITANYWHGIYIYSSSSHNTISGNNIRNSYIGIDLLSGSNNSIVGNNVTNNWGQGIYLSSSSNNTFYHNNLINNAEQVDISPSYSSKNVWDDGFEGNYWSDYTGVDSNRDGTGDSWYNITQNNTDHYPLMGPFHSFNTTLGKYFNVISNSTIDSFRYFESNSTIIIHVSNVTANQTRGFCRISIPYEVMSEPFNVTIDGADPTYWNYTLYDNETHRWIYFEYEHTTREIVIIPEFPLFLILPLFMIATLLAVIAYKKKCPIEK